MDKPSPFGDQSLIWFRSKPQRGPRPTLSLPEITRVALELADEEGLDAVSMRRIGGKLGAGATSLYSYVSRKEDLYELLVDEVIGEIPLPEEPSGDWRADLRQIACDTHTVLRRHKWTVLLGIQPGLGPKTRRYSQAAFATLEALAADRRTLVNVVATVNNYIFGFILREVAWEQLRQRSGLTEAQWLARLGDYVHEAEGQDRELAEMVATRIGLSSPDSFDFGLDCLLDGIVAQLPRSISKSSGRNAARGSSRGTASRREPS